jgi:hypothetical protein
VRWSELLRFWSNLRAVTDRGGEVLMATCFDFFEISTALPDDCEDVLIVRVYRAVQKKQKKFVYLLTV